jgi:hypothetical protein
MMDVPSSFVSGAAWLALSTAVDMHFDGILLGDDHGKSVIAILSPDLTLQIGQLQLACCVSL